MCQTVLEPVSDILISCLTKTFNSTFQYRSYKKFNENDFITELSYIPFHICDVFDDLDDVNWAFNKMLSDVVNTHAPIKHTKRRRYHVPFMNSQLRKARNVKAMLLRTYRKFRSPRNWEMYRRQRNLVTKLKRNSISNYFQNRCAHLD